jgi:hypothetical protein
MLIFICGQQFPKLLPPAKRLWKASRRSWTRSRSCETKGKFLEDEYKKMRQEILATPSRGKITRTKEERKTATPPIEPPKAVLPKPEEKKGIQEPSY